MGPKRNRVWGGVDVGGCKAWSAFDNNMRVGYGNGTGVHVFAGNGESRRFGGGGENRVWMMQDFCMHPRAPDYGRGLSDSAWARAVQKRPFNEAVLSNAVADEKFRVSAVEFDNGGALKLGEEVLKSEGLVTGMVDQIDVKKEENEEGDSEKEEGELEEGEIVMDMDELTHEAVKEEHEEDVNESSVDAAMEMDTPSSIDHGCQTEALEAVSLYQRKFGSSERLPSPTPSEDHDIKDNDCRGEVSSSLAAPDHGSLSLLPNTSAAPSANIGVVQRPSTVVTSTAVSSGINPTKTTSGRSRDPRLLYAGLDVCSLDLKQPWLVVGNMASIPVPAWGTIGPKSELSRSFEGSNLDGLATKRQRIGLLNSVNAGEVDSTAGTGGLLDDNTSGTMFTSKDQMAGMGNGLRDPRTGVAGCSSGVVKPGYQTVPPIDNLSTSLPPELLKNIALNPTMLLEVIKRDGQQDIVREPLQMYKGVVKLKARDPRRVLFSSKLQSATLPVHCSAETKMSINVQIPECQANRKPVSSQVTTADITRKNTENLKTVTNIMASYQLENTPSVASQTQSSASRLAELKTDTSSMSEDGVTGMCKSQTTWSDVEHLFDGYDDHQKAAIQKDRAKRLDEQMKMFSERKLCLVLDLDHTLLNSAKFGEIDPVHEDLLRKIEEQDREKPFRHLFRLPHMGMWTKLRPGVWNFLEKASKLFKLHLYTMGNKVYASEMARILDPKGVLFAGRVISRGDDGDVIAGDDKASRTKDLEGVMGMESSVIILDDSIRVWPHHKPNLIAVDRYIYFPCSRRQFGLTGPSLLEIGHDERPEDGTLASYLAVTERVHEIFFSQGDLDNVDVRAILASEQQKILSGCRIVFSHVFPVAEVSPHLQPLWRMAEQFGASCTNQVDDEVTHVVAMSPGTNKVNWALSSGRLVVHPNWVEASAVLYRRANERDFAIKP